MYISNLKIHICDFWSGFRFEDTIIYKILSSHFNIEQSTRNPDLIIHSLFGFSNFNYSGKKIKFVGEPDLYDGNSEYEIGMDYNESLKNSNYFYLPLYFLDHYNFNHYNSNPTKFSCILCSHLTTEREMFFREFEKVFDIDSGGASLNNMKGRIEKEDTSDFYRDHKFSVSFENTVSPGYLTEKIFDSLINGCVPIYKGDPRVEEIVNPESFINANNLDFQEVIELVKNITPSEYENLRTVKILRDEDYPNRLYRKLENYLLNIIT